MVIQHTGTFTHKPGRVRSAFTMIELVFAIVIISISILALPTVLLNDASSQEQTLKEEGIMLTTTKISQILTYPWDAQSQPPVGGAVSTSQVLNTVNANAALARNGITDFRIGHFINDLRRRMTPFSAPRIAGAIPIGGNPKTNIGDFNGDVTTVGGVGDKAAGYKKEYQTTTRVAYVADAANYAANAIVFGFSDVQLANSTNIKMVRVTTDERDSAGNWVPIIQMTSYSANIGEAEFAKRRY